MANLLELRNVTKVFRGGTVALDNISFSIDAESPGIVAVAGESGSGKTTLGLMVLGFLDPSDGEVRYNFTAPKQVLEIFRAVCQGQTEPHAKLCEVDARPGRL